MCLNVNTVHKPDTDSVRLMSTNLWIILHCCKSNASQNTRLIDRMTEILLTFKKPHIEENKLPMNSKIQKNDPLLVSFRFGKGPFTFANCQKVSAPFGCQISL